MSQAESLAPLLTVCGLRKAFGGVQAVQDVGFDLAAGEMLALIGPNGAGKSTTFNLVNGQLRADAGSVRLRGRELCGLPPRRIALLSFPRLHVRFAFDGVPPSVRAAFMRHFDLHTHRGGG